MGLLTRSVALTAHHKTNGRRHLQASLGLALLLWAATAAAAQVELSLQGQPCAGGDVTLVIAAPTHAGSLAMIVLGLDALPILEPVATNKGAFYIGHLLSLIPIGMVPPTGMLSLPVQMPPYDPVLQGTPAVLQAYVGHTLSNPALLSFDAPHLLPSNVQIIEHPAPVEGASFGSRVTAGDLNADGIPDVVVGAWFEKVGPLGKAGRVYVFWGPDHLTFTRLTPPVPKEWGLFSGGLMITDYDNDGVDDLVVGETSGGDPPTPGAKGHLYLYRGGPLFPTSPAVTITGTETGLPAGAFGSLLAIGDFNADHVVDIAVGSPDSVVAGVPKAGRMEIHWGPAFQVVTLIENPEPHVNDFFATSLATADVNGDGIDDLVEASGRASVNGISQAGRVHVFAGPALSLLHTVDNPEPSTNDRFGEGMIAHDFNGDGLIDIVASDVKNHFYIAWGDAFAGSVSVWSKPPSPSPSQGSDSAFGYFMAANDVNADGRDDLVIADIFEGNLTGCSPLGNGGALYVMLAPYFSTAYRIVSPVAHCGDEFGWAAVSVPVAAGSTAAILAGDDTSDASGLQNVGQAFIITP